MNQSVRVSNSNDIQHFTNSLSAAQDHMASAFFRGQSIQSDIPTVAQPLYRIATTHDRVTGIHVASKATIEAIESGDSEGANKILQELSVASLVGLLAMPAGMSLAGRFAAYEVFARHGMNKQSHGFIHEVMIRNRANRYWNRARLGPTNKPGHDVLIRGRPPIEAKSGTATKTVVNNLSRYSGSQIYGTKEFARQANALKPGTARSSGISNATINKAKGHIGNIQGAQTGLSQGARQSLAARASAKAVVGTASRAMGVGAVAGGLMAAAFSAPDLINGRISAGQFTNNVARESVAGGVGLAAGTLVKGGLLAVGVIPGGVAVVAAVAVTVVVAAGVSRLWRRLFR